MALFLTRLGSLNALRDVSGCRFWRTWLKAHLPSADTLGRVAAGLNTERLRFALHHVYDRLKRNKALPLNLGRAVAVIDGHESFCSYDRHCSRCLERIVHTASGDRLQYYHRYVALMLLPVPSAAATHYACCSTWRCNFPARTKSPPPGACWSAC